MGCLLCGGGEGQAVGALSIPRRPRPGSTNAALTGLGRAAGSRRPLALARRLAHGIEPVAGSAHRDDLETEFAESAQLLPQPADMDIDRLAVAQVVVTPDLLEQDLAGEDPTRAAHQVGEQFPLLRRQL